MEKSLCLIYAGMEQAMTCSSEQRLSLQAVKGLDSMKTAEYGAKEFSVQWNTAVMCMSVGRTPLHSGRARSAAIASDWYWSSSENNNNNAWRQSFSSGDQNNNNKNNNNCVRPIRGCMRPYRGISPDMPLFFELMAGDR